MVARKGTKKLVGVWLEEAMVKRMERFGRKHGLNKTDTVKAALTFYLAHLEAGIVPPEGA
ncbi:hypothetical protein MYX64_01630 [Nitrospinae bacterium AH_259_B05_G02_I21]|nr:hypothetical protein [Nitrospinae bacterium AH_259_B05_G02_I21]MDA2932138.1 hypothetical protein [Nitrospinae bacterium AH-259-F20]